MTTKRYDEIAQLQLLLVPPRGWRELLLPTVRELNLFGEFRKLGFFFIFVRLSHPSVYYYIFDRKMLNVTQIEYIFIIIC